MQQRCDFRLICVLLFFYLFFTGAWVSVQKRSHCKGDIDVCVLFIHFTLHSHFHLLKGKKHLDSVYKYFWGQIRGSVFDISFSF